MSLDLVNLSGNITRLTSQTSNSNVIDSNILKLQKLAASIEDERAKLQKEKAELRKFKKQMDAEKTQWRVEKTNMQNQKEMIRHQMQKSRSMQSMAAEVDSKQRKEQKELKKRIEKLQQELTITKRKLMSAQRKGNGDTEKKLKAMEKRLAAEKKQNKQLKQNMDQLESELMVTRRKLMSTERKQKSGVSDAKYKAVLRKWMKARKKLKLALLELQDRTNFYRKRQAEFKKKQQKWLRAQKSALKNNKEAVKYVFIDDIVQVKIHKKHKDRVKVMNKKGKEMLVENVKIVHDKPKKRKKKKGAKDNDFVDDDPSWLYQDEIVQQILDDVDKEDEYESSFFSTEESGMNGLDDIYSDDDFEDDLQVIRGDVMEWKEEMAKRNEDMMILMSIAMNQSRDGDKKKELNFDDLMQGIMERNQERFGFEEIADEELTADLEDDDGERRRRQIGDESDDDEDEMKDNKRKNHYDESMKLLKTNCEEYVMKLKSAITNIQSIVETKNTNKPRRSVMVSTHDAHSLLPSDVAANVSHIFAEDEMLVLSNPDVIGEEIAERYIGELDARCKDIQLMHDIFYSSYSNEDKSTLKDLEGIVRNIDGRIDEIEDDEYLVGSIQGWKLQFQTYVIREGMMMRELSERRDEVKQIFDVIDISGSGNKALSNRLSTLAGKVDGRYMALTDIVDNAKYNAILGGRSKVIITNEDDIDSEQKQGDHSADFVEILENVAGFDHENEEWKRFMSKLKAEADVESSQKWKSSKSGTSAASSKIVENCVKRTIQETDARTADVGQLKEVLLSKDSTASGELLNAIEDRHKKLNEANNDIIKSHVNCAQYCVSEDNNSSWWKSIQEIVINDKIMTVAKEIVYKTPETADYDSEYETESFSLMIPLSPQFMALTPSSAPVSVKGVDYNENMKFVLSTGSTVTENEAEIKDDAETKEAATDSDHLEEHLEDEDWWLMLDEERNKVIERIHVTTEENGVLSKLAVFASRILKYDALSSMDKVTKLYVPIDLNAYPSAQFRCLATLFDGVIVAKLLCLINDDLIDFRGIHKPNPDKPYPLKAHEVNENISVILSSLKSMGIVLDKMYSIKDWWNPGTYSKLLINLLTEIASHELDRFCSFKKHPELMLLKKETESISSLSMFDGEKWINRWINYMLKRSGVKNFDIDNVSLIKFNKDFMKIMGLLKKRNSIILSKPNATKTDNAKTFIKLAKHSFNVDTPIEPEDFTNNNRFCQNYFAAQIFDKLNGLTLTEEMKKELDEAQNAEIDGFDEREREAVMAWLNSFGLRNRVENLNDISSGITLLKVLDKLKKGSVSWKKVHLHVRHKFDHVINCNYVVNVLEKQLGLKFVNVSGMDIVDKNFLMIKSILWRIMRYQSVKILSDLQFGSNVDKVNNTEIIKWCNTKLVHAFGQNLKCKQIKSLKDSSLSTGMYYLELIRAIMPSAINTDLVNSNLPPLSSSIKKDFNLHDKHYKKRRENLKYTMTIIRRYGVDLFINVDDLFRMEQRAVVSVLAALMTISLSQKEIITKQEETKEEKKDEVNVNDLFDEEETKSPENKEEPQYTEETQNEEISAKEEISTEKEVTENTPITTPNSAESVKAKSPSPKADKPRKSAKGKSKPKAKANAKEKGQTKAKGKGKESKATKTTKSTKGAKGTKPAKGTKEKSKKTKKTTKNKKATPHTPLKMDKVDDLDFDSVLDEVDSSYERSEK